MSPTDVAARLLGLRWLVRAPIALYRARLGFLFGSRLLMLEHVGRTTGGRCYVVLEVVARPRPNRYVVLSGHGEGAQWLRNVAASPDVRVTTGRHGPRDAAAERLPASEVGQALREYAAAHPRTWVRLRAVLERTSGADLGDAEPALPGIALDLVEAR